MVNRTLNLCGLSLLLLVASATCEPKVPIVDVGAFFAIADTTWFEDEQTLFIFYRVDSDQGLSDRSQIELAFRTDDVDQGFAEIETFENIHPHVVADCGLHTICGSWSVKVELPPRDVRLRLRYHEDGPLTLDADVDAHVTGTGPAFTQRSAIVYGVFDEANQRLQWRLRHQFPAIRNEDAQALGLRRSFTINDPAHGTVSLDVEAQLLGDPYGYALPSLCPADFTPLGFAEVSTTDRAVFAAEVMPELTASASGDVCAAATVVDALGPFTAPALARKNPEVAPAFPALQSPIAVSTQLPFMLETCGDIVSETHRVMQLQRMRLSEADVVCIDDFATLGFSDRLARRFQDRINAERDAGDATLRDMVLVIGLNRADSNDAVSIAVEAALAQVVDEENGKSSPRLSGAMVFDSEGYAPRSAAVARLVLWCPAGLPGDNLETISNVSLRSCAVQLAEDIKLGPVRIASLPILPTRDQYLGFVERFNEDLAGSTTSLTFRSPIRTPLSDDVELGEFGRATFFNNEAISADVDDSFSFCPSPDPSAASVVIRIADVPDLLPLQLLPDVHDAFPQPRYALGIAWDAPFLLQMKYDAVLAGSVTAVGLTIPFGPHSPAEQFLGSPLWEQARIDLAEVLLQCSRFCDHPTFDSSGVYNVNDLFSGFYRNQCYAPNFPESTDGGFPIDP
ncbi:MAG: hypothetical protein Q8O67_30405 [Deltaproteobacteria bacterium]|nr:hypothetical protein [Deltaproteobacteria bacterium]